MVPLLLSIGEEVTALTKATESGDTDLVYLVRFHGPAMEFHRTIQPRSLARDLFVRYARVYKREFLKNFLASTGDVQDVAFLSLKESWEMAKNPVPSRGSPINGPCIKLIENAHKLFSETKDHVFESKEAEEHAKLLRIQQELEITTKQPIFVDSSVVDTIRTCIVLGNPPAALKVKTEFKRSTRCIEKITVDGGSCDFYQALNGLLRKLYLMEYRRIKDQEKNDVDLEINEDTESLRGKSPGSLSIDLPLGSIPKEVAKWKQKFIVTIALTILTSSQAILMVWSKRAGKYEYSVTTANFMVESLKCVISLAALLRIWEREGVTEDNRLSTTVDEVGAYPIPAAIYLVKNLLQYYIFAYVDAPGYQILKNLNIISTGILYRLTYGIRAK